MNLNNNKVFFTSDLHFGHSNIIRYDKRPFKDVNTMDETIIKNWNNKVSDEDIVYILGDISWYNEDITIEILKKLKGIKILVKGNHDRITKNIEKEFYEVCDYKEIYLNKKQLIVLMHYPIFAYKNQFHGSILLYGHVHETEQYNQLLELKKKYPEFKGYNVGCMLYNYEPVELSEILEKDT